MGHTVFGDHYWEPSDELESWENLALYTEDTLTSFIKEASNSINFLGLSSAESIFDLKTMDRLLYLTNLLSQSIRDASNDALLLPQWAFLGSSLESSLQAFLTVYLNDYGNGGIELWDQYEADKEKKRIIEELDRLRDEGAISSKIHESVKRAVKDTVRKHTKPLTVERTSLNHLIDFITKVEIISGEERIVFRTIRDCRNAIHFYRDRKIDDAKSFRKCLTTYCIVIDRLKGSLPTANKG